MRRTPIEVTGRWISHAHPIRTEEPVMELRQTITITVNRTPYTLDHGMITVIASKREHAKSAARAGSARDNAFILRDLRRWVADQLGTDQRTAYDILAKIKYADLFQS